MFESKEGKNVPQVTFVLRENDEWKTLTSDEIFAGKTVVLFALPGAFTPTCSTTHLPRYNALEPVFKANGVDSIVCLSVNDTFVMNAWKDDQNAPNIQFLPDGNGDFSEGMGFLVDKSDLGFGKRSWRYSMLVKDGVVEKMFIEPELPGDPFKVSDADTMLNYINPKAEEPARVTIFTKPGCPHCAKAKATLVEKGMSYEEIVLGQNGVTYSSLTAITGAGTAPQTYVDGVRIGGNEELQEWFAKQESA